VNNNRRAREEPPRGPSGPVRRVTVTSPRTRAARPAPRGEVARDIDEQTRLGEVYIASLMRAQLRLALTVCSVFGCLLGGLPLLFALQPALRGLRVLGVPFAWLVLGVVVYPALLAGGWLYVRQAESNERDFADLVERS
jgi:hypothetical protein